MKANSVLCIQCGKWNHGRFAGVERLTSMFSKNGNRNLGCSKCEENIVEALDLKNCVIKWKH